MKLMTFSYAESCLLSHDELAAAGKKLVPEIERIQKAVTDGGYGTQYASVNLPVDEQMHEVVKKIVQEKKELRPTMLVVIGIGGSNLGTVAVQQALYGKFYNEYDPEVKVYFADAVDTDYLYDIVLLVEQELERGDTVVLNVVSKSGTTTETIVNFELFLYLLRKAKKENYQNCVVTTTDEGSKLWEFAQQEGFTRLAVPKHVGGRYSIFSAVGTFPLELIGINTDLLHKGAQSIIPACINTDIFNNPAALSAAILAIQYRKGINIHDTFLFSMDLRALGNWYRQLMGESVGKEFDMQGKKVNVGITPTVSIGSTDLHSMAQLYLAGPYDKFTTFVSVQKRKSNVVLPRYEEFEKLVAKIQGTSVSSISDAILQGVQIAYTKNKRPFVSIVLPEKSPYYIGQFMQFKMLEMIYLGFLLDVNPFDQPNVETYKEETRKLLKK